MVEAKKSWSEELLDHHNQLGWARPELAIPPAHPRLCVSMAYESVILRQEGGYVSVCRHIDLVDGAVHRGSYVRTREGICPRCANRGAVPPHISSARRMYLVPVVSVQPWRVQSVKNTNQVASVLPGRGTTARVEAGAARPGHWAVGWLRTYIAVQEDVTLPAHDAGTYYTVRYDRLYRTAIFDKTNPEHVLAALAAHTYPGAVDTRTACIGVRDRLHLVPTLDLSPLILEE